LDSFLKPSGGFIVILLFDVYYFKLPLDLDFLPILLNINYLLLLLLEGLNIDLFGDYDLLIGDLSSLRFILLEDNYWSKSDEAMLIYELLSTLYSF
jgi:hypothetical protein